MARAVTAHPGVLLRVAGSNTSTSVPSTGTDSNDNEGGGGAERQAGGVVSSTLKFSKGGFQGGRGNHQGAEWFISGVSRQRGAHAPAVPLRSSQSDLIPSHLLSHHTLFVHQR